MTRAEATVAALEARRTRGLTYAELAERAGADRVFLTAALHGQQALSADQAQAIGEALGLPDDAVAALQEIPTRGSFPSLPPTDPTIYRLYEVLQVYGPSLKALIHEDFGDGIMSAINFKLAVERGENQAGARVRIIFDGKWLPYEWVGSD